MKTRLQKEIRLIAILLVIGVVYYMFVAKTGVGVPCVFNLITGLKCPACGVTRMIMSIGKLDFAAAYRYNPVIFVTSPVILGCIAYERIIYVRNGTHKLPMVCNIVLWIEIVILLIYGVIRNIG